MFLDYLTSEVELEESEIRRSDPNIPIDNNCTDGNLRIGMSGGTGDTEDEGVESDVCDAIPTASRCRRPETELERFDFGSSDLDWYEGKDGDDADVDEEAEASQADDGSTQNVED
jgi:hypothetical protein